MAAQQGISGGAAKKTASGSVSGPSGPSGSSRAPESKSRRQVVKDAAKTDLAAGGPDNPEANEVAAAQIAADHKQRKDASERGKHATDKRGGATVKGDRKRKGAPKLVAWAWSGNRRILTAQFIACVVIVGLGTLTAPQGSKDDVTRMMVKFSALSGLFFILALVSSGGTGAAKVSTALGTLVTTAYVVTSSDAHNVVSWVGAFFRKPTGEGAGEPVGSGTMTPGGGGTGEPLTGGEGAGEPV